MANPKKQDTTKKKIENLVKEVKPETTVTYGKLLVGFYDNPRTYVNADGEEIKEDRLYIDIKVADAKQQHVRRKARDEEVAKFNKAHRLYLEAKSNGGLEASETIIAKKDAEIEELRSQLSEKQNAEKNKNAIETAIEEAAATATGKAPKAPKPRPVENN